MGWFCCCQFSQSKAFALGSCRCAASPKAEPDSGRGALFVRCPLALGWARAVSQLSGCHLRPPLLAAYFSIFFLFSQLCHSRHVKRDGVTSQPCKVFQGFSCKSSTSSWHGSARREVTRDGVGMGTSQAGIAVRHFLTCRHSFWPPPVTYGIMTGADA